MIALLDRWFRPAPASRLGLFRLAVGGYWLYRLVDTREDLFEIVGVDPSLFEPVGLAVLLDGPVPAARYAWGVYVTIALCVAWTAGFCWRVVGPAFALALYAILSYRLSWGALHHESHLPTLHALVLATGPAAAGISFDAALRRRFGGSAWVRALTWQPAGTGTSFHYGWPLRLVCAVTTLTYCLAGLAKWTGKAGAAWASGDNLRDQIGYIALHQELLASGALPSVPFVYAHPWILGPAAVGAFLLELLAPIALLGGPIAPLWAGGIVGMHWGIRAIMGITFPYPMSGIPFLAFLPLERVLPARWR